MGESNVLFESEELTVFVDALLPLPIPRYFTYRVPRQWASWVEAGLRIVVPFGSTKVLTAVIVSVHHQPPKQYQAKYILEILDESPLVTASQIALFQWVANYYMCYPGEVFQVALPAGLKISSQSKVQIHPEFQAMQELTDKETVIYQAIQEKGSLSYDEVARVAEVKSPYHHIKAMVGKGAILIYDELKDRYTPKVQRRIRLAQAYANKDAITTLIGELESKTKQISVLLHYLQFIPVMRDAESNLRGLEKSSFTQAGLSESALQTLIKHGIFESFEIIVSRFGTDSDDFIPASFDLNGPQEKAYQSILQQFQEKETVLLHGITGSGKTEIYIRLIQEALANGDQVLYLLPEIALTTQIVARLKKIFGEQVGIYHSKFSDNERVEVWKSIVEGKYPFVVGVRSAVFLPFSRLGLIIVDEEHESSFKQVDPAPRYHARDVAMVLAGQQKAKVLLGSATPSIESYYQAKQGKYGLVSLMERFGKATLPEMTLIDTKYATKMKQMKGGFSVDLITMLDQNFQKGKQSLLFQNRRGYSPYIQCQDCDWIAECNQCDVSLTYHAKDQELRCHYCGYREGLLRRCGACGGTNLKTMGYGTEKLEEELQLLIPDARIGRMDLDTTRSKSAFNSLLAEIQSGNIDILVGTQMVAKGLDFEGLSTVAIFDADRIINFPDFRAHERAFQLITQVAGRAGRRDEQGQVFIQTNQPSHRLFQYIQSGDYAALYADEIVEREGYHYPPFVRLIKLTLRHMECNQVEKAAFELGSMLKAKYGHGRILGPERPLIERIRNQFVMEILIKLEKGVSLAQFKVDLRLVLDALPSKPDFKGVQVIPDVDCL
jgi:primosomal protein N' (replication factor Y) (superfamily II helicase)